MSAIELIRAKWHDDKTTPQEREWLIILLAAIREDRQRSIRRMNA